MRRFVCSWFPRYHTEFDIYRDGFTTGILIVLMIDLIKKTDELSTMIIAAAGYLLGAAMIIAAYCRLER